MKALIGITCVVVLIVALAGGFLIFRELNKTPTHDLLSRIDTIDTEMTAIRQRLYDNSKWSDEDQHRFSELRTERRQIYNELTDRGVKAPPDTQSDFNGLKRRDPTSGTLPK